MQRSAKKLKISYNSIKLSCLRSSCLTVSQLAASLYVDTETGVLQVTLYLHKQSLFLGLVTLSDGLLIFADEI